MNEQKKLNLQEIAHEESQVADLAARLEGRAVEQTKPVWVESFAASGKPTANAAPQFDKTLSVTL